MVTYIFVLLNVRKERGRLVTLVWLTGGTRPDSVTANPLKNSREDGNRFIFHLDSHQVINPSHLATRNVRTLDKAASCQMTFQRVRCFLSSIFFVSKKTWMETHDSKKHVNITKAFYVCVCVCVSDEETVTFAHKSMTQTHVSYFYYNFPNAPYLLW